MRAASEFERWQLELWYKDERGGHKEEYAPVWHYQLSEGMLFFAHDELSQSSSMISLDLIAQVKAIKIPRGYQMVSEELKDIEREHGIAGQHFSAREVAAYYNNRRSIVLTPVQKSLINSWLSGYTFKTGKAVGRTTAVQALMFYLENH